MYNRTSMAQAQEALEGVTNLSAQRSHLAAEAAGDVHEAPPSWAREAAPAAFEALSGGFTHPAGRSIAGLYVTPGTRRAVAANGGLAYTTCTMAVIWRTIGVRKQHRLGGPLLVGGALVAVLLLLVAAPCERRLCVRPDTSAQAGAAAAHTDGPTLPMAEPGPHCALHCGGLLLTALLFVGLPVLTTRVAHTARPAPLRASAPPPLPPPQAA